MQRHPDVRQGERSGQQGSGGAGCVSGSMRRGPSGPARKQRAETVQGSARLGFKAFGPASPSAWRRASGRQRTRSNRATAGGMDRPREDVGCPSSRASVATPPCALWVKYRSARLAPPRPPESRSSRAARAAGPGRSARPGGHPGQGGSRSAVERVSNQRIGQPRSRGRSAGPSSPSRSWIIPPAATAKAIPPQTAIRRARRNPFDPEVSHCNLLPHPRRGPTDPVASGR